MRREAHLAALRYDEERQKTRHLQRDTKVPAGPPLVQLNVWSREVHLTPGVFTSLTENGSESNSTPDGE